MKITRRALLGAASATLATTALEKPASAAAEFEFKLGVNTPDAHPLTLRLTEAARDRRVVVRPVEHHGFRQQPTRR